MQAMGGADCNPHLPLASRDNRPTLLGYGCPSRDTKAGYYKKEWGCGMLNRTLKEGFLLKSTLCWKSIRSSGGPIVGKLQPGMKLREEERVAAAA